MFVFNENIDDKNLVEKHNFFVKMPKNPKISLIIPTYFEEKILENLLSKFNNNIREKYQCEIIVSDGGSTDKTIEIAKKFADKIVENTSGKKQTISEGRNCGAKIAKGEVLVFLNADCMPENIEIFFETISNFSNNLSENLNKIDNNLSNKNATAIACKVKSFEEEEKFIDKIFYLIHNNYVKFLLFLGIGMGRGECQIVKKEVFENIGGYNSELVAGEDFDLFRRIAKSGEKIIFSDKILINESSRRFRKYGYFKTIWFWTLNSLTVMFFNKSVSKDWEAIR
jgi:glycosyltransferase involved in cell wall biosynthesis